MPGTAGNCATRVHPAGNESPMVPADAELLNSPLDDSELLPPLPARYPPAAAATPSATSSATAPPPRARRRGAAGASSGGAASVVGPAARCAAAGTVTAAAWAVAAPAAAATSPRRVVAVAGAPLEPLPGRMVVTPAGSTPNAARASAISRPADG